MPPGSEVSESVLQEESSKLEPACVDLCPKYAHASGGQECGPPQLIVRISGGLVYCLHGTVVWKTQNLVLVPTVGGKSRSTNKHISAPVELTNSDRQLTHSSKRRPVSGREAAAGGSTSSRLRLRLSGNVCFFFFLLNTDVSRTGPNSTSGF